MNTPIARSPKRYAIFPIFAALLWAGLALAQAKSAILFIGDGMGPNTVKAASIKLRGADGKLIMQGFPAAGSITTRSADSDVTDSAAAATALATGNKTDNGTVSMTPDGKTLKTVLEVCRDAGKKTGLVATSSVTHATPACFASHVENRGREFDIAGQLVRSRVNAILGGGKKYFLKADGDAWIGVDFLDEKDKKVGAWGERMRSKSDRKAEMKLLAPPGAAKAKVWVWRQSGLVAILDDFEFEGGTAKLVNGDFEKGGLDGWNVWSGCEIIADGGSSALQVAGGGGLDQVVVVEPGREYSFGFRGRISDPDAGNPDRSFPWDEAEKAGYLRIETKREMNRARGPLVLGLFQPEAMEMKPEEPTLAEMTEKALELIGSSDEGFFLMVEGSQIDWAAHGNDTEDLFRQMASFDEAIKVAKKFAGKRGDILVVVTADHETGGVSVKGTKPADLEISYSTNDHTAANTPLFAFGPGSEAFAGAHDNTDVPKLIAKALSLDF